MSSNSYTSDEFPFRPFCGITSILGKAPATTRWRQHHDSYSQSVAALPAGAAAAGEEGETPAPINQWNTDLAASYQQFFSSFSAADTMAAQLNPKSAY